MSSINVSDYDSKLAQHSYRHDVANVVASWERDKLELFLSNLTEDQIDDPLPNYRDMSTDDMKKLSCLVVWNWGWEGSDYFIKMYR